jgi:hypothetical protein
METPEKVKNNARFQDFGEMVEYDVFGGIVELYADSNVGEAFRVDSLIAYMHPAAKTGKLVIMNESYFLKEDPNRSNLRLTLSPSAVQKPYTGPRGHLPVAASYSLASALPESDVIEDDIEDDCSKVKDPTF